MRKLIRIDVNFISLVDKGANRKKLIFKSMPEISESFAKTLRIKKCDEEQRMVFCIVYSPNEVDAQGDIAAAEVIKDAAYNFMRCARTNNVDKQHDCIPDEGFVAESWIVKENDPVFPDEPAGSWAVGIKVENDDTWQLVKSGEITGISLAGLAVTEEITKNDSSLLEKIRELFHLKNNSNLNDLQNWFAGPGTDRFEEVMEKVNANDDLLKSIDSKISLLERSAGELASKIEHLEKTTSGSRQVRSEEMSHQQRIKIWT